MDAPGGKVPWPAPTGVSTRTYSAPASPASAPENTNVCSPTHVVGTASASAARSLSRVPIITRPTRDRRMARTTSAARPTTARQNSYRTHWLSRYKRFHSTGGHVVVGTNSGKFTGLGQYE